MNKRRGRPPNLKPPTSRGTARSGVVPGSDWPAAGRDQQAGCRPAPHGTRRAGSSHSGKMFAVPGGHYRWPILLRRGTAAFCLACLWCRPFAPFGERLRALRLAAGLTQVELAPVRRVGAFALCLRGPQPRQPILGGCSQASPRAGPRAGVAGTRRQEGTLTAPSGARPPSSHRLRHPFRTGAANLPRPFPALRRKRIGNFLDRRASTDYHTNSAEGAAASMRQPPPADQPMIPADR